MKGKNYDYKEAYNKNLTAKARLHYLENARNDQDDSPVKQVGIVGCVWIVGITAAGIVC